MSLFNLLSISDDDMEIVLAAMAQWSSATGLSPDCDEGRIAMAKAVDLTVTGERDLQMIARKLASPTHQQHPSSATLANSTIVIEESTIDIC